MVRYKILINPKPTRGDVQRQGKCVVTPTPGPAPGTDDWHADRPAVVSKGARAIVKEKMAARDKHREELPGQVASLQQMQQRSRELREELERRSRGNPRMNM